MQTLPASEAVGIGTTSALEVALVMQTASVELDVVGKVVVHTGPVLDGVIGRLSAVTKTVVVARSVNRIVFVARM